MKTAYLINQYPKGSHAFIRREIAEMEEAAGSVMRMSIRQTAELLADPLDRAEARRTRTLLEAGSLQLGLAGLVMLLRRPARFLSAMRAAVGLGRRSDRGVAIHLVYLAEACLLARMLAPENVDHLHAHFGTNPAAVALLCSILGGPGYSFTVHGPEEFDRPRELGLERKIAAARFVVAISEFGRSQLYRWARPEDWEKCHIVHCGVDRDFLEIAPTAVPDSPRLVCVGRLCAEKGHALLLRAAARLHAEEIPLELVFIGDGLLRGMLEEMTRKLGLEGSVTFRGWQSGATIREAILNSRGLVLASFAEGLPVVLMESLALCRPVIATQIAGIPELVKDRENGWLVPAGNVEALAQAMQEMLAAPAERLLEMGKAGARRVRECHDARKEAGKLADLFRRYAGGHKAKTHEVQETPEIAEVNERVGVPL